MIRCDLCKEEVYKGKERKGSIEVHGADIRQVAPPGSPASIYVKPYSTLCLYINMCDKCSEAVLKEGISGITINAPDALRDDWNKGD